MQSHRDTEHEDRFRQQFMDELKGRAKEISSAGQSKITGGYPDENDVETFKANGVHFVQRPDDPQGILRISIGGGPDTPVELNYCTFRGDRMKCVALLKKALDGLRDKR